MEVWEHWGHKFKPQLNQVIEPRNPCGPEWHPETAAEPGPHAEASALAAHGGACRWALPSGGLGCPRAPELRVCAAHAPKAGVHPRGPFLEAPPAPGAAGPGTPSCCQPHSVSAALTVEAGLRPEETLQAVSSVPPGDQRRVGTLPWAGRPSEGLRALLSAPPFLPQKRRGRMRGPPQRPRAL